MSQPRLLTDRAALLRQRARAEQQGSAMFLHDEALFEVQERLIDVNRSFTSPAIVTGIRISGRKLSPMHGLCRTKTLWRWSLRRMIWLFTQCAYTGQTTLSVSWSSAAAL